MSVTVAGSIALDDIVTQSDSRTGVPGGSALYAGVAASLFSRVNLVGVIGVDFPSPEIDFLVERGVGLDNVMRVPDGETFRWACEYDTGMHTRKTTGLSRNVHADYHPSLNVAACSARVVFLGSLDPDMQLEICTMLDDSTFVMADTIECYLREKPGRFLDVMGTVDLAVISDAEAIMLTGETSTVSAARLLAKDTSSGRLIVKKGEHGSFFVTRDGFYMLPAYPVERCVDPTGAGDVYSGSIAGFLAGKELIDDAAIREAMLYGTIISSFLVEDFSYLSLKHLTTAGLEDRVRAFRRMIYSEPESKRNM